MLLTGVKDLDFKILNELEDKDLVNVCKTNKAADDICTDQNFWRNRIQTKFPYLSLGVLDKYKGDRKWSEYYIDDLIKKRTDYIIDVYQPRVVNSKYIYGSPEDREDLIIIALENLNKNIGLMDPSRYGHFEVVKYLVEHKGYDIHNRDDIAVQVANYYKHSDIVEYLVSMGAPDPRI